MLSANARKWGSGLASAVSLGFWIVSATTVLRTQHLLQQPPPRHVELIIEHGTKIHARLPPNIHLSVHPTPSSVCPSDTFNLYHPLVCPPRHPPFCPSVSLSSSFRTPTHSSHPSIQTVTATSLHLSTQPGAICPSSHIEQGQGDGSAGKDGGLQTPWLKFNPQEPA